MDRPYREKEWLRARYVVSGLTSAEVAGSCGVTKETVARWVSRHGLSRAYDDIQWLRERYAHRGMTVEELAEQCEGTASAIQRWVDRFNLDGPHHDRGWLDQLYIIQRMSIEAVANRVGINTKTLEGHIERHGLKRGSVHESEWWLWKHHWKRGEPLAEIGKLCRKPQPAVVASMRERQVPIRPNNILPLDGAPKSRTIPRIKHLYRNRLRTYPEIADIIGCSEKFVGHAVRQAGVSRGWYIASCLAQLSLRDRQKLYDKEWIEEKYKRERLSYTEIAKLLDTQASTVRKWIRNHGLRVCHMRYKPPEVDDRPWLIKQYWKNDKSVSAIAKELGVFKSELESKLVSHNIPRKQDSYKAQGESHILCDRLKVRELLVQKQHTQSEIGKVLGCKEGYASKRIRRMDLPIYRARLSEIRTSSTTTRRDYGSDFRESRRVAWRRDLGQCVVCGMDEHHSQEEYGRGLHAHHIIPVTEAKEIDEVNTHSPENLITVCVSCHPTVEHNPLILLKESYTDRSLPLFNTPNLSWAMLRDD